MSESWLNDSWENAFLLQAHHDLICVHRRTRSPHPEAHKETCHDQAGHHRHCKGEGCHGQGCLKRGDDEGRRAMMMMMMMMMTMIMMMPQKSKTKAC